MKRVLQNERGMALALAIFALVVVGALVAGAFFAGTQEQRVGENWRRLQQSFGAAETGLNEVIRNWNPQTINRIRQYPLDSMQVPLNPADSLTPDHSELYGNPPVNGDTSVHPSTFNQFGDITYASLAASATIQLGGGNYKIQPTFSGTVCNRSDPMNWGDGMNPTQPCGNYFPMIHIAGS